MPIPALRSLAGLLLGAVPVVALAQAPSYENPLPVTGPGGPVESCADPTVVADGDAGWVMLCTTDPLGAYDRDADDELIFNLLPTFRSDDLVHWTHAGNAFGYRPDGSPDLPDWIDPTAVLWAPEIDRIGGVYVLTFAVTDVTEAAGGAPACDEDSAIGLAVADSPLGPWEVMDGPLVAPRRAGNGCEFFWTLDPEVVEAGDGRLVIYYGSYYGGIEARELRRTEDGGFEAPSATARPIAIPNRYEGAEVVAHDGFFYLFASATNCCAGPQTGYAVFVGRSGDPFGPFLDEDGVSMLDEKVGGTPVLAQNGDGWVGVGHNTLVQDRAGQWWTLYHGVEEARPYFEGEPGFTRRPVLMDQVDWVEGWPVVNGGAGPSAGPVPAPALAGAEAVAPRPPVAEPRLEPVADLAEGFDGASLGPRWSWRREPASGVEVTGGVLRMATQDADLYEDRDDAPVLLTDLPEGDLAVDLKVRLVPPPRGCCQNFVQAGLVIAEGDDAYVKLVVASIWETRQTEFARELPDPAEGVPRYGNTVVAAPGEDWTWLRVVVQRREGPDLFTPYTSRDDATWRRGGSWTHDLGATPRLGLVAMGGAGFTAEFDDLAVSRLVWEGGG